MRPEAAIDAALAEREHTLHQFQVAMNQAVSQIAALGTQIDEYERQMALVGDQIEALREARQRLETDVSVFADWMQEH